MNSENVKLERRSDEKNHLKNNKKGLIISEFLFSLEVKQTTYIPCNFKYVRNREVQITWIFTKGSACLLVIEKTYLFCYFNRSLFTCSLTLKRRAQFLYLTYLIILDIIKYTVTSIITYIFYVNMYINIEYNKMVTLVDYKYN